MALKAGYKGIKGNLLKQVMDKLLKLDVIIPEGASADDPLAIQSEIDGLYSYNSFNGSKNLLPVTNDSDTINGVTFTVNKDGYGNVTSITVNGTNDQAGNADFPLIKGLTTRVSPESLGYKIGKPYTLSGLSGGTSSTVVMMFNGSVANRFKCTAGKITDYFVEGDLVFPCIRVAPGVTVDHAEVKPMFVIASDTDESYVPYAKTNRQLTVDADTLFASASDQKTTINAIITAATGAADFAAFKTAMGAITPVTRSIQTVPDEVREDPEPETRSTKKSTKKTTE